MFVLYLSPEEASYYGIKSQVGCIYCTKAEHAAMLIMTTATFQCNSFIFASQSLCQTSQSLELAIDDSDNQQNQHRNDRNRYNPICSHPEPVSN